MHAGMKTLVNISSQLHQHLEGKVVLIGKILKLDIPLEYFFGRNIAHSLGEAVEDRHPLIPHFWYGVNFFLHLLEIKNVIVPLVLSSLRTLKDHLLWL
jgi:hypothetical protein